MINTQVYKGRAMKRTEQQYCPCGEPKIGPSKYCNKCKDIRRTPKGRKDYKYK